MRRSSSTGFSFLRVLFTCSLVALLANSASAADKNKKNNEAAKAKQAAAAAQATINQRQAEIADAQAAKAASDAVAANAQSKLAAAQAANENARSNGEAVSEAVAAARKKVAELETNILGSQPADSPYGVARKRMEDARTALTQARDRILKDPDYLARYNEAKALPDPAVKMAAVRSEALGADAPYVEAERSVQGLVTVFNQLERELLGQDPEWVAATSELKQLLPQLVDTKDQLQASSLKSAAANQTLRNAAAQSNAAAASIAQDQAAINAAQKKAGDAKKKADTKKKK